MSEFLAMGEHGLYVWSAYGASLLVLALIVGWPLLAIARLAKRLRRELAEDRYSGSAPNSRSVQR